MSQTAACKLGPGELGRISPQGLCHGISPLRWPKAFQKNWPKWGFIASLRLLGAWVCWWPPLLHKGRSKQKGQSRDGGIEERALETMGRFSCSWGCQLPYPSLGQPATALPAPCYGAAGTGPLCSSTPGNLWLCRLPSCANGEEPAREDPEELKHPGRRGRESFQSVHPETSYRHLSARRGGEQHGVNVTSCGPRGNPPKDSQLK